MSKNEKEHFEGHGNHWDAFGDKDALAKYLPTTIYEGKFIEECLVKRGQDKVIFSTTYPQEGNLQFCCTMSNLHNDEAIEVVTFHPLLKGFENEVVVSNTHEWENKIEGEVEASVGKVDLSFFAPFYYSEFSDVKVGEKILVYLSGLAYSAENAIMEYKIDKGEFYEMVLGDFLKENPEKTRDDFPFASISADGLPILFPTNCYSEYEYRGKIFEIDEIIIWGKKFAKAKICVGRKADIEDLDDSDNDDVFINLYIVEHIAKESDLKIGNDIQGILWLMGTKRA